MTTATRTVSNMDDLIDIRDVIDRFEELTDRKADSPEHFSADNDIELRQLSDLLDDLRGYGGDHQWRGDWYPVTLVRDSYFEDHARELAEDVGAIKGDESWPLNCIDWQQAARELQTDYSQTDFGGVTYWYR